MAEVRCEAVGAAFEFFEESFDSIPISMCDGLKSEILLEECSFEPRCAVDEKQTAGDVVFLGEFVEKLFCEDDRSGGRA